MSLIDLFKRFHRIAIQQGYPPFTRVLFDTLLYKFNSRYWIDRIALSQMDLSEWTGLNKKALQDAQHFLTSRHIIEIQKTKRETYYSLGAEWQPDEKSNEDAEKSNDENRAGTPNTAQEFSDNSMVENFDPPKFRKSSAKVPQVDPNESISYIRARKDKEDFKTLDDCLDSSMARARESDLDKAESLWKAIGGGRLSIEHLSKLELYLKAHGLEWAEDVMREASDSNTNPYGLSPKYLFAALERRAKPGEKSGKREQMREVEGEVREYYAAAETHTDLIDYKKYLKGD